MKKVCLYVQQPYLQNKIFEENNLHLNKNDILAPFRRLRQIFEKNGFSLDTQDMTPIETADAILYCEMPHQLPDLNMKQKSYLFACETALINPNNWITTFHKHFKTIFTIIQYKNSFAEFIQLNFPQKFRTKPKIVPFAQKKLCTMVSGAKLSFQKDELYSSRMKWINWFTKNHPSDFDFYGTGWKKLIIIGPIYHRILNKVPYFTRLFRPRMDLYRGLADNKYEVLNKYKFSICYENVDHVNGNLSEKIFDCFFANNVPIYLGAADILKYIPKECFINPTDFVSFEQIYEYISKMDEETYNKYLVHADNFINSSAFDNHSIENFSRTLAEKITRDLS